MTPSDGIATGSAKAAGQSSDESCTSISLLMLRWQATGAAAAFEAIVDAVRPQVEQVAKWVLRRHGLRDPAAVDDAVSLVFDHLRRLSASQIGARSVAEFVPASSWARCDASRDPGRQFIVCLTTNRARDVVRSRRRQKSVPFSQLGADATRAFEQTIAAPAAATAGPPPIDRVRTAVARLEPRQRLLVEMLLEGKSQAMIAHVLGVCEGTVSRLRARTIAAIQMLVEE
ncbi:MAG: RNA polymerase sigma factor [Planctomycetota bacterium]